MKKILCISMFIEIDICDLLSKNRMFLNCLYNMPHFL